MSGLTAKILPSRPPFVGPEPLKLVQRGFNWQYDIDIFELHLGKIKYLYMHHSTMSSSTTSLVKHLFVAFILTWCDHEDAPFPEHADGVSSPVKEALAAILEEKEAEDEAEEPEEVEEAEEVEEQELEEAEKEITADEESNPGVITVKQIHAAYRRAIQQCGRCTEEHLQESGLAPRTPVSSATC